MGAPGTVPEPGPVGGRVSASTVSGMVVSSIVVLVVVPTVYSSEIAAGTVEPGLIVAGPAGTVTTPMVAVEPSVVSVIVHVEPASRPS